MKSKKFYLIAVDIESFPSIGKAYSLFSVIQFKLIYLKVNWNAMVTPVTRPQRVAVDGDAVHRKDLH